MKKVIKSRKAKNFTKLLPYIIAYSILLTGCSQDERVIYQEVTAEESTAIPETETIEYVEISLPEETNVIVTEEETEEGPIVEETEEIVEEEIEEHVEKKVVALTFDDGPSKYTSELVDILEANNAHATFFLVGVNISANSDGVVKAYEHGNEIAIHTYSHTSFTKMTIEDVINEIEMTRDIIEDLGVEPANLVRPPYGNINDEIKNSINTSFILWNVDTEDWKSRDVETIKEEVYKAISEGDIILFHDVYPTTIEAVKELLPELSEEYEFVSVSELFERYEKELEPNTKYYGLKR